MQLHGSEAVYQSEPSVLRGRLSGKPTYTPVGMQACVHETSYTSQRPRNLATARIRGRAPPSPTAGMPRRKAGATQPRSLVVLKDGHVGSEWFAEAMQRQPATRFIFEMGPCITGSLPGKLAFVTEKRGCACSKEDCQLFKRDIQQAPCLDSPHARACNVLGGSHMSVAADSEVVQWQQALTNATGVTIVVQTRSNLVKWAWSFLRTGASHRFLYWQRQKQSNGSAAPRIKELNHLRSESNRSKEKAVRVEPAHLLRLVLAKQRRSERLLEIARKLAMQVGQRRERVVLYESLQTDMEGELRKLYRSMGVPFSVEAHRSVPRNSLLKHATEDLTRAISNWRELEGALRPYPCLLEMLHDKERRAFADCNGLRGGRCACSWRTPIVPRNLSALGRQQRRAAVALAAQMRRHVHGGRGRRGVGASSHHLPARHGEQTPADAVMAKAGGMLGLMLLLLVTGVARSGWWPRRCTLVQAATKRRRVRDAAVQTPSSVEVRHRGGDGFHSGIALRYPSDVRSRPPLETDEAR